MKIPFETIKAKASIIVMTLDCPGVWAGAGIYLDALERVKTKKGKIKQADAYKALLDYYNADPPTDYGEHFSATVLMIYCASFFENLDETREAVERHKEVFGDGC